MIQIILVVFGIFLDMVYGSRLVRFMDIQQPKPQLELVFVMALGVVEFSSGVRMFKVPWTFNCHFYPYILKVQKSAESAFQPQKICREKCANRDNKIPRQQCVYQ